VKNLRWRLGLKGCLAVDSRGKHGGLALFFDENIQVKLLSTDERYIDVSVQDNPNANPWRVRFVYGEPRVEDRHRMREILQRLKTRSREPWLVVGDFNEAMWQYEHFSETKRGEKQMADFREVLDFCGLKDIGFLGLPWTYDNKKPGNRNVKVRLDRGVAARSWLNRFFDAWITHLTSPCSNHCPLLLAVQQEKREKGGGRQVYYEIMWEREASLGSASSRHGGRRTRRAIWE
jgi:endonuclease/exonuclease/phosphatase family metal-dependent hydrolase